MDIITQSNEAKMFEHLQRIEATLITKLNLADFQNAIPMFCELTVFNEAPESVDNLELRVESIPAFLKPKIWRLNSVGSGKSYQIPNPDVQLDGSLLTRLTEAENAFVSIVLCYQGEPLNELARIERTVELLPRNQWGGLSHLPDMIAAFVQPNEPAVERLLKKAADVLRKNDKNPALDGYAGGSKRSWELVSSIWSVVAGMGLDYALPPASFEYSGQKIRGAAQITESGLATCLDLALLFCSAIEQVGLNPLLVFTKGHAFAGVWLKPKEFSTTVIDDVTALRKRIKLQELVLFETTVITQRPAPSFSYAIQLGAQQISEEKEETFELAIDIRRARLHRIKPLASAELPIFTTEIIDSLQAIELPIENSPDLPDDEVFDVVDNANLSPKDRVAHWQRKLLDLSLRNNLLNFKKGKKALKLEAPNPGALEDLLSDGQVVKLLPRPVLMNGLDPRNQAIYEDREHENLRRGHALDALERREVFVDIPQAELDAQLVDLYRKSRTSQQEGGANTLFLAIGFLSWTQDDKAGQSYRAPLILLPVTLNRRSVRSGFTLTLHDDEPRFNPTLIEMLRQDFKLNLGVTDGELPKDEAGLDVASIWKTVSVAIKDIRGWEVVEDIILATFSFSKYLMWKDLVERTDQLRENPVVRHLIDSPRESYPSSIAFPDPKKLDNDFKPEQTFCPLPVDSSQLSAVMAAVKGKDFVLIGPPGTGKSQTISNIIAQCLAEKKRGLFVSEKIAALDVVYRRLRAVGLGDFCLELHSSKARKLDVLAQLQKSWEARGEIDSEVWRAEAQRLKKMRDQLNIYVERLHFPHPNGLTLFKAIGRVTFGHNVPELRLFWDSANAHDSTSMEALRDVVGRLEVNAKAVGQSSLLNNPFAAIGHSEWSPKWQQTFIDATQRTLLKAKAVEKTYEQFVQTAGLPQTSLIPKVLKATAILAKLLPHAFGRDLQFLLRDDAIEIAERLNEGAKLVTKHQELSSGLSSQWSDVTLNACQRGIELLTRRQEVVALLGASWVPKDIERLKNGLRLFREIDELKQEISVQYSEGIELIEVHQVQREWAKAEKSIWPVSWFRKKKICKKLNELVIGEGKSETDKDIELLVRIRALRAEISALNVNIEAESVWTGLTTRTELVQCALDFQHALNAAKNGQNWEEVGFELIANGHCSMKMSADLNELRILKILDADLKSLESLGLPTSGLWAGLSTQILQLQAALKFQEALRDIRDSGTLNGDHTVVANEKCGTILYKDFKILRSRESVENQIAEYGNLQDITSGLWSGLKTNTEKINNTLKISSYLTSVITNLANTSDQMRALKASLEYLFGNGNALTKTGGSLDEIGGEYSNALTALYPEIESLILAGSFTEKSKTKFIELPLNEIIEQCNSIINTENQLHSWCAWRKVCDQARVAGLASLVEGLENNSMIGTPLQLAFETNYCRWWLNTVVEGEPIIKSFVSVEHEKRIDDYRALDDRFTELTRSWVRASLCAELPTQDSVTKNSEWGILRHEINKKKRHISLRELISRIPLALPKLTPCLLMSPLSIAQYFSTNTTLFDVVVFDEASQIPVWDAVGAIARGKQVVMVGDPKQLPPTNFFNRTESDLDDEDIEGDLESILDECMGANIPTMNLSWHYRSRHESLIAFSNHHYYGGSLVTFPSPFTEDHAVSFHYIKGVYEKGGARINKPEAMALVADLINKLKSPGFSESKLTIGVVTFNSEQQSLIEDLLDDERRKDPSIEPHFAEIELEPIFVKNLESVQGDERDIMYFSVTYGPDLAGVTSMNFGPMNRNGGERRLNVAITRARHELRVFSSLKPDQLNLARTQAHGVRDLKHFLEFAERGPRALAEEISGSRDDFESPFEEAVASALARKGWELHTQIGVSTFRVDLGVVHPDRPGTYLTGIECDGATYHRSATARDRDKLREQVLRGLGWEILRVWSTDWWINPIGTLEKIDASLKCLLETSRLKRTSEAETEAARLISEEALTLVSDKVISSPQLNDSGKDTPAYVYATSSPMNEKPAGNFHFLDNAPPNLFVEADPCSVMNGINSGIFFDANYEPLLHQMIAYVIEVEGPVLDSVLARRVARAHGWQRTGTRIQKRVDALAAIAHQVTQEEVGTFYWPQNIGPEIPLQFRSVANNVSRAVGEICMPELISLAREVMKSGKMGDDVVIGMAREMGLQRLMGPSKERLGKASRQAGLGNTLPAQTQDDSACTTSN